MSFLDQFRNFEPDRIRNSIISIISGFLFALGWWIAIDAAVLYAENDALPNAYHTAGVFSTIAFILINSVPNGVLRDEFSDSHIGRRGGLICLFIAFSMAFSSIIAACWILFGGYVSAGKTPVWPGVAILFQNLLICTSSILFKFGRKELNDF
ncbi:Transmembrane protein [Schistosoma japonicum]|uniref:SJCHGC05476 protein n=1 Tax=Schistosoma japonicum TaxID=6182 RepID=Q5DFX7_SCHJA|nr:SJCHGC05476 protein [Schistosoma japonicum]KAH8872244.1 Transmembrane protein 50A [Schistosoma japonicum]KAH8872245.1 Transmembrane protein 50A [Schistosoma japonicum]TNN07946.1 Transmembrane protein [Schistosoma japonicum]TNN07947.1 Transmembrane protein [Schistosoma japonicum]